MLGSPQMSQTHHFSKGCRTGIRSRAAHLFLMLGWKSKRSPQPLEKYFFFSAASPLSHSEWLLNVWMEGKGLKGARPVSSPSIVLLLHPICWRNMFAEHPALYISHSKSPIHFSFTSSNKTPPARSGPSLSRASPSLNKGVK